MSVKKIIAAATVPAMMASPVAAANPAASLSLRGDSGETATATENADASAAQAAAVPGAIAGLPAAVVIGGLVVVLVVLGAVALGSGDNGSTPASA